MKRLLVIIWVLATSYVVFGQNKMTLEDFFLGKYKSNKPKQFQWMGASDNYCYYQNGIIWSGSIKSSKVKELLSNESFKKITGKDLSEYSKYTFLSEDTVLFTTASKQNILLIDLKKKSIVKDIKLSIEADSINISRQAQIAYTVKNNLFVVNDKGEVKQVTDNPEGVVSGKSVNRSEFGLKSATLWSDSGKLLAFYEKDEREIRDYPLIDYSSDFPEVKNLKYPFAGTNLPKVRIGVYNLADNSKTYLNTGDTKGYITNIVFGPLDETIYAVLINREQTKLTVKQYDAITGEYIRTIFSESHDTYIEPENGLLFLKSKQVEFLWLSEKSGYKHLYHYTIDGELLNPLTEGEWEIDRIIGFDNKDENIYFTGTTSDAPYERHVYCANVISLRVTKVTKEPGWHNAVLNKATGNIIDCYSSTDNVFIARVLDNKGNVLSEVSNVKSPFEGMAEPGVSIESINAADGETNLWMKLIKPSDFDENKKYPVVMYVYGGPHIQTVKNVWKGDESMLLYLLAEQGFVVAMVDSRGSAGRGLAFENQTHNQLGKLEAEDQLAAIKYLKTKKWTNNVKFGIYGVSYGGFMTLKMLLTYPDECIAGVSIFPVTDWKYYEIMYTERYMGTPESNPEGYTSANMIEQVDKLNADLMVIGGVLDEITLPINTYKFIDACMEKQKPVDFYMFPFANHGMNSMGAVHQYYYSVLHYFTEKLK